MFTNVTAEATPAAMEKITATHTMIPKVLFIFAPSSSYNQLAVEKSEGKQVTAYTCVLRIWDNGSVQAGGAVFLLEV